MTTVEDILIQVGVDIRGMGRLDALQKKMFGRNQPQLTKASQLAARAQANSNKQMAKGAKMMNDIRRATKPFKMELLSLGFGFAMVARGMKSLLTPAFETVGIFDIFSTMLQVTFLPIALFLLENILLPLFDFFTSLPEPIQFVIGAFVALVAAIASIGSVISFLGLFWDQFVVGLATLKNIFSGIASIFSPFLAILLVVALAVYGFWKAWKENFGRIREWVNVIWTGVKTVIDGIKNSISGIIDIFTGFFTLDGEKIKTGFKKLFDGIVDVIKGSLSALVGVLVVLGLSILRGIIALLPEPLEGAVLKFLKLNEGGHESAELQASVLASNQTGGYIPHTGLYKLHRGEMVQPSNETFNFSPVMNISGGGMNAMDIVTRLKMELNQQWATELARISRS